MAPRIVSVSGHTFIVDALPPTPTVLDLGANRGAFSVKMRELWQARCFLVEANPALAEICARQFGSSVLQAAAGDRDAVVEFNVAANDEGSSLLKLPEISTYGCTLSQTVQVPQFSLATIIGKFGLPSIDLLKMDIEGAEAMVLNSAADEILQGVTQITVEFHVDATFGFDIGAETKRAFQRLAALGFATIDFSRRKQMDVLFVNRRRFPLTRWREFAWNALYSPPKFVTVTWDNCPESLKALGRRKIKSRSSVE